MTVNVFDNIKIFNFILTNLIKFEFPLSNVMNLIWHLLAMLAQMVACLPLLQQVQGSIPGGAVNFNLKIFNLGARRGGDVHFLIARFLHHNPGLNSREGI